MRSELIDTFLDKVDILPVSFKNEFNTMFNEVIHVCIDFNAQHYNRHTPVHVFVTKVLDSFFDANIQHLTTLDEQYTKSFLVFLKDSHPLLMERLNELSLEYRLY